MPPFIDDTEDQFTRRSIWVNGPVIVGAGPSGLAVAAGFKDQGVPFIILERADCIASLWQHRTYDRLKLNLPKQFCQLPNYPFPDRFPEYPTKLQFINYLESYAKHFNITPQFNETVQSAKYETFGLWRVKTIRNNDSEVEYICRWLVVATGENSEKVVPEFEGLLDQFGGHVMHACDYKSGESYSGQKVLVVGCGNSGIDVSLDLCYHNAKPSMVVRSSDRESDIGALEKIRSGQIKMVPGIRRFLPGKVELVDGKVLDIDSVVLATGYRSNVPSWLKENDFFSNDGIPRNPFPNGWKGNAGLYAVGFTMRGIFGASWYAINVSRDIGKSWKDETKQRKKTVAVSTVEEAGQSSVEEEGEKSIHSSAESNATSAS